MNTYKKIIATKEDWDIEPMPAERDSFFLNRNFTSEQITILSYGHIPKEMEDRWFCYMEDNILYVYRSWSGICIYEVHFGKDNIHEVIVNRDDSQYTSESIEKDKGIIDRLIDR